MAGLIFLWQQGGDTPPPPPPPSVEEARGGDGFHRQYSRGEKRKRGLEWDKREDDLESRLRRAYARIKGEDVSDAVTAQVAEAVRPHVDAPTDTPLPAAEAIDWRGLIADLDAVNALLAAYAAAQDDDDWLTFMMLS